jgi:hypothetical protein
VTIFFLLIFFSLSLLHVLDTVGMHDAFVAIGFSVATGYTRAIHRTDVVFMLIVISFVIAGTRQIFFAGGQTKCDRQDHQAMGKECFHVFEF